MNSFYGHHRDSIRWQYRCFDRILLNGLIQPFQQPERVVGFFNTYRQLYPVSRHVLRDIADQFQRWLKGWSEKRNIPVADAPKGRRDDFVDPYFKGAAASASISIIGWPTACVRRASTSSNVPMPSRDALSPNASSNSPTFAHPLGFVALRPKVAGAPHAILYRQGAAGIRLR